MDCVSDCYDEFTERQKQCPCEVNNGKNHVIFSEIFAKLTFFKENCIGGCPCENYSCAETTPSPDVTTTSLPETTTSPTANAVLVLSTKNAANKPMIVDFDGKNTFKVNFVIFFR